MLRPASNFSTPTTWAKSEIVSTKFPALTLRNQPRAECIWMLSISTLYSGAVSVWSGYLTETLRQFWELLRANQMMNEEQKSDAIDLARLTGNIAAQTGLGWAVPGVSVTATGTHFARLTLLPSFLPLSHYSTMIYTSLPCSTCRNIN